MVQDLKDFIEEINKIIQPSNGFNTSTLPWFRGQSNESWELIPPIYRNDGNGYFERELTRDFILINDDNKNQINDFETQIQMQHYGIPTRLLDWTENYLCALFFALQDFKSTTNAVVFIFYPWELNKLTLPKLKLFKEKDQLIPTSLDNRIKDYLIDFELVERQVKPEYPIAFRPQRVNPRIRAQKGMFTIHGNKTSGLESILEHLQNKGKSTIIKKIIIKGTEKSKILKQLFIAGVTNSSFFPERAGICNDLSFRYSKEFTDKEYSHCFSGF